MIVSVVKFMWLVKLGGFEGKFVRLGKYLLLLFTFAYALYFNGYVVESMSLYM